MDERKKLIDLMVNVIEKTDYSCEICTKMGFECKVRIPENAKSDFIPDFTKCDFKDRIYKTLTIES